MPLCCMDCTFWTRASIRFCIFSGWYDHCRICLERLPQVCSIGLRYGNMVSQFITLIPSTSRKVMDTRTVWARALSWIKMNASAITPANGLTIGSRISLRCIATVIPALTSTYRTVRPSKDISSNATKSPHRTDNVTGCVSFSLTSPHPSRSTISWVSGDVVIFEEYWLPVTKMPVLVFGSKVDSHGTVFLSENLASGSSSGSRTIITESIPHSLVEQVNFRSTAEVNFQRPSCTHVIATRHKDKKTVLSWGWQPGTALILSPGVLSHPQLTYP